MDAKQLQDGLSLTKMATACPFTFLDNLKSFVTWFNLSNFIWLYTFNFYQSFAQDRILSKDRMLTKIHVGAKMAEAFLLALVNTTYMSFIT